MVEEAEFNLKRDNGQLLHPKDACLLKTGSILAILTPDFKIITFSSLHGSKLKQFDFPPDIKLISIHSYTN